MDSSEIKPNSPFSELTRQTFLECEAMARYALSSGLKVSGALLQRIKALDSAITRGDTDPDGANIRSLADCHHQLSRLIAPAMPRTILLLDTESRRKGIVRLMGPVPLIRQMMVAAVISLVALICLTLSPEVNGSASSSDILVGSGLPLLVNELFLLSAAALGASFSALFIANRYIQEGTFDPRYNISYWILFVLGMIAGFILATLIDFSALHPSAGAATSGATPFARPLLAMVGGFSATVVYRILNRLAEAVESLFRGDVREEAKSKLDAERRQIRSEVEQGRAQLAYRLMALQQKLGADGTQGEFKEEFDALLRELTGDDAGPAPEAVSG